jgi:hypothetical protein
MPELGFLELTTSTGSALWLVAGSVFAIEKDPNETFTWVKTPSGDFGVMESPQAVMTQLHEVFDGPPDPGDICKECGADISDDLTQLSDTHHSSCSRYEDPDDDRD